MPTLSPPGPSAAAGPSSGSGRSFSAAFRSELAALMAWRRDVRRFRRDPLPEGLVAELLEAAATAPSVGLSEPWRFVLVESEGARAAVRESFERCNADALARRRGDEAATYARLKLAGLDEAPVQIAAFCHEDTQKGRRLGAETMPEMRRYSVVCAVMQLWLIARAHGVGVGWVSIIEPAAVARVCSAPAGWDLVAYLCLGYPQEEHLDCELERAGWERRARLEDRITRA